MARLIDGIQGHAKIWSSWQAQRRAGRLAHALAFSGPIEAGKTAMAWALAQALCCERDDGPCGECPSCRRVERRQSESVLLIEPEKNSIRLENAHRVLEFLSLRQLGRARIVLIEDAHSLNPQAANALLKAIEEPPPESYFILMTSEVSQLLPTLRSRLQIVRFGLTRLETSCDPELQDLRRRVVDFVLGALQGRRVQFDEVVQESRDRESGWHVIHLLQQVLRDWSLGDHAEWIHADLKGSFAPFSQIPEGQRLELWRRAFQMESDHRAHVDRHLLFENFYRQASHAMD